MFRQQRRTDVDHHSLISTIEAGLSAARGCVALMHRKGEPGATMAADLQLEHDITEIVMH
jgi:hypothetical protein